MFINSADSALSSLRAFNRPCYTGFHEDKFTESIFDRYGGKNFISVSEYLSDARQTVERISNEQGVYFVTTMYPNEPDEFLVVGTGGFYRGQNPNEDLVELRRKWVDGASILYIGKAGGRRADGTLYSTTLRKRIRQLLRFGTGHNAPHYGGRYLWQCEGSDAFKVYWYPSSGDEDPIELERQLIDQFVQHYGKLPFANCCRGAVR